MKSIGVQNNTELHWFIFCLQKRWHFTKYILHLVPQKIVCKIFKHCIPLWNGSW